MKSPTIFLTAALVCLSISAAIPSVSTLPAPSEALSTSLNRRAEYNENELPLLLGEAKRPTMAQIYSSIDYLANVWKSNGFTWALTGGIAMQKYGMSDRTTEDSDMFISATVLGLSKAVADDPKCAIL